MPWQTKPSPRSATTSRCLKRSKLRSPDANPPQVDAFGFPIGDPIPGWTQRPRPTRAAREGLFCRLDPLDPGRHAAALFAAYAEAADWRHWTYLPSEPPTDAGPFRHEIARRARSRDPLHFAVTVDGEALGTAALMRIDPANGVIEIGHIAYAPRLQRTRAGTEAIYLLMRWALDELGYRRLEWKCDSHNASSRRAALRYGFTYEGTFRQAIVTKGRNRDTAWYSIVDAEWPEIRQAFERWLAPDNFDPEGRQRTALTTGTAARELTGAGV